MRTGTVYATHTYTPTREATVVNRLIDEVTGVLQADIATWAGVSYHTVREWRLGRRSPSPDAAVRLAEGARKYAARVVKLADQLERRVGR